jgi:hypothetical protein
MKPAGRRWYRDGQLEREQEADSASRMPKNVICHPAPGDFRAIKLTPEEERDVADVLLREIAESNALLDRILSEWEYEP